MDAYWRAANYLTACQLYLLDNPLLEQPLTAEHIKKKIVGHWGTCPGQNFIYTHLNRVIKAYDLDMIYLSGPGHGGNAMVAQDWLDGSYQEVYPDISQDREGMQRLFKRFSFPGGIPSHVAPETPGSINEGGELGYSLAHAFGAVTDNPSLIAATVVGDGEAETGPLATSWQLNKFLSAETDGAVLPILHLNGYKIANPTVLARIPHEELESFFLGCGWQPYFVEGSDPAEMHRKMADTLDKCVESILGFQKAAREEGVTERPRWPMIVLRTPKGWTGPDYVDGAKVEGYWRAHQVPIQPDSAEHIRQIENWLKSYKPEELFDANGEPVQALKDLPPKGNRRMGANPHANGGQLLRDLRMPDFRDYAVEVPFPGAVEAQDMAKVGEFVRDIYRLNAERRNFRSFGPDETTSNRLTPVFQEADRIWMGQIEEGDDHLSTDGRVMDSMLSEHVCQGMLEGYLLTGRHGFFNSYEAFIRIVDSMFSQHAKWLKVCNQLPWRHKIASLNYVLASNVWQQDHNGFTHQDPGFLDHMVNKKADVVRLYLPPDANCLLSCFDHCIRSRNYVNAIVASKHPRPQWLTMEQAVKHCTQGIGIWQWASHRQGRGAGHRHGLLRRHAHPGDPGRRHHPAGRLPGAEDPGGERGGPDAPAGQHPAPPRPEPAGVRPALHPGQAHPLRLPRLSQPDPRADLQARNKNLHVRGYIEEGTITTPFDMRVLNKLDRFNLVMAAVYNLPQLGNRGAYLIQQMKDKLVEHKQYIAEYGVDLPEVTNWKWT